MIRSGCQVPSRLLAKKQDGSSYFGVVVEDEDTMPNLTNVSRSDNSICPKVNYAPKDKVDWLYESRRGYGYSYNVAGVVIHATEKRIRIAVYNKTLQQVQYKSVTPDRLSYRTKYVPEIDDAVIDEICPEMAAPESGVLA